MVDQLLNFQIQAFPGGNIKNEKLENMASMFQRIIKYCILSRCWLICEGFLCEFRLAAILDRRFSRVSSSDGRLEALETYSAPQAGYFLASVHGFFCQQDAFKEMGWENPHDFSSRTLEVVEILSYSNVFNVVADWCVSSRDGVDGRVAASPLWRETPGLRRQLFHQLFPL